MCVKVGQLGSSGGRECKSEVPPTAADIEGFSHLEGVTFNELPDKNIGVLLSVKYAWSWMGGEVRRGSPRELVAFLTCYGWMDGWMDGWMGGQTKPFKEMLGAAKNQFVVFLI